MRNAPGRRTWRAALRVLAVCAAALAGVVRLAGCRAPSGEERGAASGTPAAAASAAEPASRADGAAAAGRTIAPMGASREPDPVPSSGWRATVLGVAQDGGLPHAGCSCVRCDGARRGERRREKVACLGLTDGKRTFLVDATPDLPEQLHAMGARVPDAVFLTHAHMGHYLGLAHLGKEALGARGVVLHGTARMEAFLRANAPWRQLFDEGRVTFDASPRVDLGGLVAEAIPVPHRGEWTDTVAWRFEGPRGSVLWLPDIDSWDRWDRPVREVVGSVAVAFLDATFFADGELPGVRMTEVPHPRVVDTMSRLAGLGDRVRLVHLNHTNPLWDAASPASADAASRGFRVAREGERVDL